MSIINGVILGVGSQSGNSKATGKPYTRFDIMFSDNQTYSTFDGALAGQATLLQGKPVSIDVSVQQNGNFTNRYLNKVAAEGELGEATPVENTQNGFSPQNNGATHEDDNKRRSKEQIARESALIAAFSSIASVEEYDSRMELAYRLYDVAVNGFPQDDPVHTPEEVAATVPNVTTGADRNW